LRRSAVQERVCSIRRLTSSMSPCPLEGPRRRSGNYRSAKCSSGRV